MNQKIIRSLTDRKKPHVTLIGKDSNAFAILGSARESMLKVGWTQAEIAEFINFAMAGNYDMLLRIVCKYCEVD